MNKHHVIIILIILSVFTILEDLGRVNSKRAQNQRLKTFKTPTTKTVRR